MKQRLAGVAALLAIAALMAGVPWLLAFAVARVRVRFDLSTLDGWRQLFSTPDNGTLLIWVLIILVAAAWVVLVFALLVEIASRLRHVSVPRLPGLEIPQAFAHGLVAAALGAVLATNTVTIGSGTATAAPVAHPADPVGPPGHARIAPQARPAPSDQSERQQTDSYVVEKGDTLWDIADDKLGDPYAYPEIYKASKRTLQPDGRRLVDPDLIYPGWKLTIPSEEPRDVSDEPSRDEEGDHDSGTGQPAVVATTSAPSPASPNASVSTQASPAQATSTAAGDASEPDQSEQVEDVDDNSKDASPLPWMLTGLGGAGALLAGSMWLWLRRRRAAQYRFRRPGRTITVPAEPGLAVVEQTLRHQGDLTSDLVDRVSQTTQRLAAGLHAAGKPIPTLLGIDVTHEHLTFRFAHTVELPDPWKPGEERREWRLRSDTDPDLIGPWDEENEPTWPTLVTLGHDDRGWRLINLETLGVITLTGDRVSAEDAVRYWIAELSVAHWGRDVEIAGGETVDQLAPLVRHRYWEHASDIIGGLIEAGTAHNHWLGVDNHAGMDDGRAAQAGPELWRPRVLVTTIDQDRLGELVDLATTHPGCTGITVIRLDGGDLPVGTEIRLTSGGRVQVPSLRLDLVANGITADEASGCAALMDAAEDPLTDAPMPDAAEPAAEWQQHCDAAGHLHTDLVIPRDTTLAALNATSVLPRPDAIYVAETANTVEDLAEIAPLVPASTTALVNEADPTLDYDLAEWRADVSDRPRLTVLGPVRLRLGRGGQPTAGIKRVAYYTEIAAYLATRPRGATADELITALGVTAERVRVDLHTLRVRLGINPKTDGYFVPKASDNSESNLRNEGIYLVEDLLCDAILFRRLRLRGEAAGAGGINDLAEALRLVTGMPYEQLRRRGGLWLAESRDDQHLLVAIVDVAHLVTTHALAAGDLRRARAAAELAHAVAPNEVTPQLDLAVIAEHEGSPDAADRIAREAIDWLDGTGEGPMDVGERADRILRAHRRLERKGRLG